MPVENTASPKVSPSAPNDSPRNVRPSSRTRRALRLTWGFVACSGTPYLLLRLSGRPVKGCRTRATTLPAQRGRTDIGRGGGCSRWALCHQLPREPEAVVRLPVAQGELEGEE